MTRRDAEDHLTWFRGTFPTQPLDARRIAGLLEAPGCRRRLVVDATSVSLPALMKLLGCAESLPSPHATQRGQRFEQLVLKNALAELIPLVRTHLHLDVRDVRQIDLEKSQIRTQNPALDTTAVRDLRVAETRRHLTRMLAADGDALNLIRHPLLAFDLAGVATYLEPDVIAWAGTQTLSPVEVKSFPMHHRAYADPHKVGVAVRQMAVYVTALRRLLTTLGGDLRIVSDDGLLVMTSGFSTRPNASTVQLRSTVTRIERLLADYPNAGSILADLPGRLELPSMPSDDASHAVRQAAALQAKEAVGAVPMRYGDGCASCPMLTFCTGEARRYNDVAQLGTVAANACGGVGTIDATFRLTTGDSTPASGAERAVAAQFGRASQALILAGVPLEY